jgi:hypothetical protein
MKGKTGILLLLPILGLLTLATSCTKTTDPVPIAVYGCMDAQAMNYNSNATIDDKSCYYVLTTASTANAVIEIYTAVRAKYGPDALSMAQSIQNSNPNNVIILNIHSGSYSIPKTGWPNYETTYGDTLAQVAGMNASLYPAGSVNRYHFADVPTIASKKVETGESTTAIFREGFQLAASYWMAKISPVNVGLGCYWTAGTRTLKITVEYYYTSAETYPNFLNVAILENGVTGKQLNNQNDTLPNYVQDHLFRTFLTGQWGESIATTTNVRLKKTYEYTVPTTINIDNCYVAAYISREINGKKVYILTGKQKKAKK